jgi:hypothetical protein
MFLKRDFVLHCFPRSVFAIMLCSGKRGQAGNLRRYAIPNL